jgi:hypothetical protein
LYSEDANEGRHMQYDVNSSHERSRITVMIETFFKIPIEDR